jgi:hypothetical protein
MQKNKKVVWGVVGVIVLVAVFYGGVSYGKSQAAATPVAYTGARTRGAGGAGGFGGFTSGSIIAKDATSITVQLMTSSGAPGTPATPSGSKIVFFDNNTKISKQANGTLADLTIGTEVSVTGTANTDGSENAQSIQIRPNMPSGAKVQ